MTKVQLFVFLVVAYIAAVYGAVYFSEISTEIVYGKTVRFCEYKGLRLLPRSIIKNYDACEKCRCTRKGLNCATLAFSVNYPDDSKCVNVRIGCKNRWVMRNNNNVSCPKRLIPQQVSMVGK